MIYQDRKTDYTFQLKLVAETQNSTVSSLLDEDGYFVCFIIEDGFREIKEKGETRIPGGCYEIVGQKYGRFYNSYKKRFSHEFVPRLLKVENFIGILIHIGNYVEDTDGCLLPNFGVNYQGDIFEGVSSRSAYDEVYDLIREAFLEGKKVFIDIKR